jgi:hypothetical protein
LWWAVIRIDDEIYADFRKTFGKMKVQNLDEVSLVLCFAALRLASAVLLTPAWHRFAECVEEWSEQIQMETVLHALQKPRRSVRFVVVLCCGLREHKPVSWASSFGGAVCGADYNFGSLLRLNAAVDYSDANTAIVPRIQFLAIEIARNREGYNNHINKDTHCSLAAATKAAAAAAAAALQPADVLLQDQKASASAASASNSAAAPAPAKKWAAFASLGRAICWTREQVRR